MPPPVTIEMNLRLSLNKQTQKGTVEGRVLLINTVLEAVKLTPWSNATEVTSQFYLFLPVTWQPLLPEA